METPNKFHLGIVTLFIHLMMCPETESSSALHIELTLKDAPKNPNVNMTINYKDLKTFKDCACNETNYQKCYIFATKSFSDTVNTAGYKVLQFTTGEIGSQYTYFSCKYNIENVYAPAVSCTRNNIFNNICHCDTTSSALLGLKCQGNPNVFITWDVTQDAWVRDYNTTEIDLIDCCFSTTTEKSTTSNLDTTTTTRERPETTTINNAANIATTTTQFSVSASRSNPATTTTKAQRDSNSVTSSKVPTTTYNNTTNQNQREQHTEEIDEFSPAYIGLVIGVCVASATVSVLITSFVMIKWHQRQDKLSNTPNRSHQERQNETVCANNIANHREGNAIEMTETNTSHGANAQGTSERLPGHGNIPHTNNNNPSSSSLQYIASGNYMEVDVPSAGPGKVARNDAYTEVKKVSMKNPADPNNSNITEDSTYSRLHATRRDMQNLYDILPHEGDDGHGGISSPYSEVAVPKPGTFLSIL